MYPGDSVGIMIVLESIYFIYLYSCQPVLSTQLFSMLKCTPESSGSFKKNPNSIYIQVNYIRNPVHRYISTSGIFKATDSPIGESTQEKSGDASNELWVNSAGFELYPHTSSLVCSAQPKSSRKEQYPYNKVSSESCR